MISDECVAEGVRRGDNAQTEPGEGRNVDGLRLRETNRLIPPRGASEQRIRIGFSRFFLLFDNL